MYPLAVLGLLIGIIVTLSSIIPYISIQKYSEEKRNEILDSQQEKNARGKISLLLNLGFPKDWIEKMLPYINEDTTS